MVLSWMMIIVCVFFSIFLLQTVSAALAELLEMRSLASLYVNIAFSFASIPQLKTQKKILQNFGLSDLEEHSCREVEEEDDEELVLDLLQFSKKSWIVRCLDLTCSSGASEKWKPGEIFHHHHHHHQLLQHRSHPQYSFPPLLHWPYYYHSSHVAHP